MYYAPALTHLLWGMWNQSERSSVFPVHQQQHLSGCFSAGAAMSQRGTREGVSLPEHDLWPLGLLSPLLQPRLSAQLLFSSCKFCSCRTSAATIHHSHCPQRNYQEIVSTEWINVQLESVKWTCLAVVGGSSAVPDSLWEKCVSVSGALPQYPL